jgi:hypothetical protein
VGYESLIVGYREDDNLRFASDRIAPTVPAGRCGVCRRNVYVNPSGAKTLRERDCAIVCRHCRNDPEVGFAPNIIEAL